MQVCVGRCYFVWLEIYDYKKKKAHRIVGFAKNSFNCMQLNMLINFFNHVGFQLRFFSVEGL